MAVTQRDLIFISYSHRDKVWRDRMRKFLEPWVPDGLLIWADDRIRAGELWDSKITQVIEQARVAVFLVSQDFLDSGFIMEREVPPLCEAADSGEVTVCCVPVGYCHQAKELGRFQWTRAPDKPLEALRKPQRNKALVQIAASIKEVLPTLESSQPQIPAASNFGAKPETPISPESEAPLASLIGVPAQRPHYVPRPELERLKKSLFSNDSKALGITGSPHKVGLHGQGGIGKTAFSLELVYDEEIQRAFPDGIYWVTLGQEPDIPSVQAELAERTGSEIAVVRSVAQGRKLLANQLASKSCLLILDDLWEYKTAEAFDVLGPTGRYLITTRDATLIKALGAHQLSLDVLHPEQALAVLAEWTDTEPSSLPDTAREVAERCGFLPLALSLAGARVHDGVPWEDVLQALREGNLQFLDHPYGNTFTSLLMSINALSDREAERYLELAVFPEDVHVPEQVIWRLWGHTAKLKPYESRDLLRRFESKALLYLDKDGGLSFHDLQQDFLRLQIDDPASLHTKLLEAFGAQLTDGTNKTNIYQFRPDHEYMWRFSGYHLKEADRLEELTQLLFTFGWLEGKLDAVGVNVLLADYAVVPRHHDVEIVAEATRLSAHILSKDQAQLAGQLLGRLMRVEGKEPTRLRREAEGGSLHTWLRPRLPSLTPPGGSELHTLTGHENEVVAVALTPDGKRAVSASWDSTLKVWNLEQGSELHTLAGHENAVVAVALTPDGNRAVSASWKKLKVWDLERGSELHTLTGHEKAVVAVALTPDGKRAVSASSDSTLKVWDLEQGNELHTLAGHEGRVVAVALTPDGKRAVSASLNRSVRVWNLNTSAFAASFYGDARFNTVSTLADGSTFFVGDQLGRLHLLQLEPGPRERDRE